MISLPIGPEFCFAVVGAPSYFEGRTKPVVPQDLTEHSCIRLRLPTHGGFYIWDFHKHGPELKVRISGRTAFNTISFMRQAALDGVGIAFLPEDQVSEAISDGHLLRVLEDWCPPRSSYHLYYSSRRQHSPAFALVIEALRYRG